VPELERRSIQAQQPVVFGRLEEAPLQAASLERRDDGAELVGIRSRGDEQRSSRILTEHCHPSGKRTLDVRPDAQGLLERFLASKLSRRQRSRELNERKRITQRLLDENAADLRGELRRRDSPEEHTGLRFIEAAYL
jgi:hypothetical protein